MDDLFEHAMETHRDRAINGFYTHVMVFIAVITGLAIINLIEGEHFWVQWVVLGWGAGVAFHAYRIFIVRPREEHAKSEMFHLLEERRRATAAATSPTPAAPPAAGESAEPAAAVGGDEDPTRRV